MTNKNPIRQNLDVRQFRKQAIGQPRNEPVTVCIATFCQGPQHSLIIGACDRMLTGELTEFEPRVSKIHHITPNIVALIAGDTAAQAAICVRVWEAKPNTVYEAAEAFSTELARHNRKQAERKILAPLGFTMRSFFDRQTHLSPEFVDEILRGIREERANVQTIICGTDHKGAHIYTVDDYGRLSYANSVGFAAVGDGAWHAQSQLMYAKYDQYWPFTRALLLTYMAKRRAEVTPGVGPDTDVFFIAPQGFTFFQPEFVAALEKSYQSITTAQAQALEAAHSETDQLFTDLIAKSQQVQPQSTPPPAQADETTARPSRRKKVRKEGSK
jgi:20S proteasome alpha/beta subunit